MANEFFVKIQNLTSDIPFLLLQMLRLFELQTDFLPLLLQLLHMLPIPFWLMLLSAAAKISLLTSCRSNIQKARYSKIMWFEWLRKQKIVYNTLHVFIHMGVTLIQIYCNAKQIKYTSDNI